MSQRRDSDSERDKASREPASARSDSARRSESLLSRSRGFGRDTLAATRRATVNSTLRDLGDDWKRLDEPRRKSLERWLFVIPAVLFCLTLLLIGLMLTNVGGTVVHLTGRSEYVSYTPLGNDPPQWYFENATISFPKPEEIADEDIFADATASEPSSDDQISAGTSSVTGVFQPHCGDTIVISRVGAGGVTVDINSDRNPVLVGQDGQPLMLNGRDENARAFTLHVPAASLPSSRPVNDGAMQASLIWPLEGRVDVGRAVGPQTRADLGLLLGGRIEIFAGHLLSNASYLVDEYDLELGDRVNLPTAYDLDRLIVDIRNKQRELVEQGGASDGQTDAANNGASRTPSLCSTFTPSSTGTYDKGFIHPSDGRGFHVSLSSNASYADVIRYRTDPVRIRSTFFKRLGNDKVISLAWAVLGACILFYRKTARLLVVMAGVRQQSEYKAGSDQ